MRRARLSGLALVGMLLMGRLVAAASPAQIYRWRDAEGAVHYSDQRPQAVEAQRIVPALSGSNTISSLSAFERRQVQRFDQRVRALLRARRSAARRLVGDQAQRRRACEAIERKLDNLQAKRRLGLSLAESNRAHSRQWQLQRERVHSCN